ncbi:hypothetical protein [Gracilinema caldarium]|uniref:hypothetical protein n=1 Tax=Gracilinema caldarium TaxID=215591 RepID=UPI0003108DC1|nr:hypothetical protein [Gracilinema caldarium]
MTVSQKVSVSLLISVLLFAAFSVIAFTGLFNLIEARFYNPSITRQALSELYIDATLVDTYINEVQNRFSDLLKVPAVQRSFLPNQSAEDIFERSKAAGLLLEATNGLQWIRFIDGGGKRIHYSTLRDDILRQDATSLAYKNYGEQLQDPPFNLINIPDKGKPRIIGDANQERLLFCFPFYDSFSVYRGTAVFSLSIRSVTERMIREGRIRIGEEVSLVSDPLGFVTGLPRSGKTVLIATIGASWKNGLLGPVTLTSDNGSRFALLSVKTESSLFVGRLLDDRLFMFPFAMKLILLASFFLTSFLLVFLLFNLEQDTTTIIRERLKRLQLSLLEEYYDKKEAIDWSRWAREMEQRREAVRRELKRGLSQKPKKKLEQDIDNLIDKSWDEIITILGGKTGPQVTTTLDEGKLQELLNRILSTVSSLPNTGMQTPVGDTRSIMKAVSKPEKPASKVEVAEAEAIEVVPSEELAEEVEEVEAAEEVEEAEAVEEVEAAEEVEEAEAVEEVEAAEEVEEAEAVEEVEAAEEAAEAEMKLAAEIPELNDIQQYQQKSNIRIVFGEDDIPTIIETSGLELVDTDEASVMAILEQKKAKELEELEPISEAGEEIDTVSELEETSALEQQDYTTEAKETPDKKSVDMETLIDEIARKIEFSPFPETTELTDTEHPEISFEIVSPFDTMLAQLKQPIMAQETESTDQDASEGITELESISEWEEHESDQGSNQDVVQELESMRPSPTQIIMFKPFSNGVKNEPPLLEEADNTVEEEAQEVEELINLDEPENNEGNVIVEDSNGLLYIANTVYQEAPKKSKELNPDLQKLVDAVLSTPKT